MDADKMMGIEKPDLEEIREVKLKLSVKHLLRLHAVRLLEGPNFSETVRAALSQYFDDPARAQPQ